MAYKSKKLKQKSHTLTRKELMERDALAFAALLYDIYQEKKRKEQSDEILQDIRKIPEGV